MLKSGNTGIKFSSPLAIKYGMTPIPEPANTAFSWATTVEESVHPELSGMAVSVVNTGCFFGTALMQPLFGYLADLTWAGTIENGIRIYSAADYHHGFFSMLVFALFALAAGLRIKETHCRNIYARSL